MITYRPKPRHTPRPVRRKATNRKPPKRQPLQPVQYCRTCGQPLLRKTKKPVSLIERALILLVAFIVLSSFLALIVR